MKTQIIRLETQDNTASICDKLAWAKASRVLLACPRRRPPMLTRVDLVLIRRTAARTGSYLAIATLDAKLIETAKTVGIPVFRSVLAAQRLPWRTRRDRGGAVPARNREPVDLNRLRKDLDSNQTRAVPTLMRWLYLLLGLAAFMAIIGCILPSAVITIPVPTQVQTVDFTVIPMVAAGEVESGNFIPASIVETVVSGQLDAAATGQLSVPDKRAKVVVTFTNSSTQAITIPAETRVIPSKNPDLSFLTQSSVDLPGGIGQQAEGLAEAENPGAAGNVPAGEINAVDGPLGIMVLVSNAAPAEGGADREGRSATESDYSQLYDKLMISLMDNARSLLANLASTDQILIPESVQLVTKLEEIQEPEIGQPSDRAKIFLKIKVQALTVEKADLNQAAESALAGLMPEGWSVETGSLSITQNSASLNHLTGLYQLDLTATRSIHLQLDTSGIPGGIQGLPIAQARQVTQKEINLDQAPNITVWPSWWPRMPFLPISIQVVYP
jgi:hypothetical protein